MTQHGRDLIVPRIPASRQDRTIALAFDYAKRTSWPILPHSIWQPP
jgi:hypothetical protein